jgi:beta-xylosidase
MIKKPILKGFYLDPSICKKDDDYYIATSTFHDDNGRKWIVNMVYDHREGNNKFAGIALQEFSESEKKLIGQSKIIFEGTELGLTEGLHLYKYHGFLLFSYCRRRNRL